MAENRRVATFVDLKSIDQWKNKPNNDIYVLFNVSISIIYVNAVPEL